MEVQWLSTMNEVSATLVRTPGTPGDLASILQHIAYTARDAFSADACVIIAINPITGKFIDSQTVVGELQVKSERLHDRPRPDGLTQKALKEGVALIEDLDVEPHYHSRFTRNEGIRAAAGLAMRTRHRQKPLGTIYLNFRNPRTFSPDDYESYRNFAVQAAFLLQETWLARHYETVARLGQEINHNLGTVDDLFLVLQNYVDAVLDDSHTLMLAVYQQQTNTLDVRLREHGETLFFKQPLVGTCAYVMENQQPWFIKRLSEEAAHLPFQWVGIEDTDPKESFIFVPVMLRGDSLGVLCIQHPLPEAYGREDQFILQLLAHHIALALHNMRLYSSLSQLNEAGQILTQQLESEQTLQATVEKIQVATQADLVILFPCELTHQRFVFTPRIAGELWNSRVDADSFSRPDDIAALMLVHKEPVFAKESQLLYSELHAGQSDGQSNFQQREQIRSTAALPLLVDDELVGILFVNFRQPQRFDATQKLFVAGLAHYAAIAIKNSQVYGRLLERRLHELEILQRVGIALTRNLDLNTVLDTLLRLAHEYVPAEEVSILLYNSKTCLLGTAGAIGPHAEASLGHTISLQDSLGITRWVVEHKKPVRVANVQHELPWRDLYLPVARGIISELDVPLIDDEEVVGVLNFESTREGAFRQEEEDFMLTLAGQAVLAIKNAQAYEREKRLVADGRVLNEISKELTGSLDSSRVFGLMVDKALELTGSARCNLMIYDPVRNDLWMAAERGVPEDKRGSRRQLSQGIVGYAASSKKLLNAGDVQQSPWKEIYLEFIPGTRSELAVPMLAGGELRGVLNVESPVPHNFGEHDERLLQGLADLAVVALQNAQAYERETRLVAEGRVLNEISQEITSQLDPVRVFNLILEKALELTHSTIGSLHLNNPHFGDLWMAAERGVPEDKRGSRRQLSQGIVGYAASSKKSLNVGDVEQSPWKEIYLEFNPGTRSELAVPMLAGSELRGVLNIESPVPHNFDESDERLINGLADLAVIALQNAERYEKASKEAQRFELLYRIGQELSKISDLTQMQQAYDAVRLIAEEQNQSHVMIRRFNEETQELEVVCASQHYGALFYPKTMDVGINGQVARERRTIVIHDTNNPPPDVVAPQPSDPATRSLLITPILFKDRYYGNLGLNHPEAGHFQGADILFFEGLAQQLAATIHRLETAKARQVLEQRAASAEEMSSIGQSAFEVTHRLDNDLGLIHFYVDDISLELEKHRIVNAKLDKKLKNILHDVKKVLTFSSEIKRNLAGWRAKGEEAGEPEILSPRALLEEAAVTSSMPLSIQIELCVDEDVADVFAIYGLVADILNNLVMNAIQAMPGGGTLTLRARNAGRSVALNVIDTGIGIPPEKLSMIFDLFFSTKHSSGFGLWSARQNALKNHGDLRVESELGKGTMFTLLLPRADLNASHGEW